MVGITSYSKVVMRLATFLGFFVSGISFLAGIFYLILKIMYWDRFSAGVAPMLIGIFSWERCSCSLSASWGICAEHQYAGIGSSACGRGRAAEF